MRPAGTERAETLSELMRTSRALVAIVVRSLSATAPELTVVQLRVLVMVGSGGTMTVNEIAAGLGVNASSASRTCERLARADLLQRHERSEDRRHSHLSLTVGGHQVVDGVMERRRSELSALLSALSPDEVAQLRGGLRALNRVAGQLDVGPGGPGTGADLHLLRWMT